MTIDRLPYSMTTEAATTQPPWLKGAVLVVAQSPECSADGWVSSRVPFISQLLRSHGAILLRGFADISHEQFEGIATRIGGQPPVAYINRSTPRTRVTGNIYTSTEYPASEHIPLHNENSYSGSWPRQILFLCVQPAPRGGETPIADCRRVYAAISRATRAQFEAKGVMYLRNYGVLGLSWQEAFQTRRREAVEAYCRDQKIEYQWTGPDELRTRQILPAVRRHPVTGESVWFNQAHLFHWSSLGVIGEEALALFGRDGVPRDARFGDGSEITAHILAEIRAAYQEHAVPIPWSRNDLVVLDNMLWAHGRRPFVGPRRVLVAMTNMTS